MTTSMKTPQAHLAVMAVEGVGNVGARKLIEAFETIDEVADAPDEAFKGVVNKTVRDILRRPGLIAEALGIAYGTLQRAERIGARVITRYDADYPQRLRGIDNEPLTLYVKGDLSCMERTVAFAGTHDPNRYGQVVTDRLASFLADSGYAIAAGMDDGVDWLCHAAALRAGVPTVAFLGSGLNMILGHERARFAEEILASGGALVSEQSLEHKQDMSSQIRRNRLRTGATAATFLTQCGTAGDAMHTMRYAVHQGRPLYAPMPPAEYAEQPENSGIVLLASTLGVNLPEVIDIKSTVHEILERDFADRAVVSPIMGRDDYPRVLQELDVAINGMEASAAPSL